MKVFRDYGVLQEESGIPYRGLFVFDRKQILSQMTINGLPMGRSVDEILPPEKSCFLTKTAPNLG